MPSSCLSHSLPKCPNAVSLLFAWSVVCSLIRSWYPTHYLTPLTLSQDCFCSACILSCRVSNGLFNVLDSGWIVSCELVNCVDFFQRIVLLDLCCEKISMWTVFILKYEQTDIQSILLYNTLEDKWNYCKLMVKSKIIIAM